MADPSQYQDLVDLNYSKGNRLGEEMMWSKAGMSLVGSLDWLHVDQPTALMTW
jgi:hypothetical protein